MLTRHRSLLVVIVMAVVLSTGSHAQPSGDRSDNQILINSYGGCAQIAVRQSKRPASVVVDEACHGWSADSCGSQLYIRSTGVRVGSGTLIYPDGRRVEAAARIDAQLQRDGDEYLHLSFLAPVCTARGFELPFTGSKIRRGEQGSADELEGTITATENGALEVRVDN